MSARYRMRARRASTAARTIAFTAARSIPGRLIATDMMRSTEESTDPHGREADHDRVMKPLRLTLTERLMSEWEQQKHQKSRCVRANQRSAMRSPQESRSGKISDAFARAEHLPLTDSLTARRACPVSVPVQHGVSEHARSSCAHMRRANEGGKGNATHVPLARIKNRIRNEDLAWEVYSPHPHTEPQWIHILLWEGYVSSKMVECRMAATSMLLRGAAPDGTSCCFKGASINIIPRD